MKSEKLHSLCCSLHCNLETRWEVDKLLEVFILEISHFKERFCHASTQINNANSYLHTLSPI